MNVKRILIIGLVLVAVVASLSFVAADSSVKVGGMDFNVPDGFSENESFAQNGKDNTIDGDFPHKLSTKLFSDGNDLVAIEVLEFDSADNAKKMYEHDKTSLTGTKTVNGKEGLYGTSDNISTFVYCKDKYVIMVLASNESLFESVVPN